MTPYQGGRSGLKHPGYSGFRIHSLESVDHGQHVHRVADRAHHHDAYVVRNVCRRGSAHSLLRKRRYSSSSAEYGSSKLSRHLRSERINLSRFAFATSGEPGELKRTRSISSTCASSPSP